MRMNRIFAALLPGVAALPLLSPALAGGPAPPAEARAAAPEFARPAASEFARAAGPLAPLAAPTPFPKPEQNVFPAGHFAPVKMRRRLRAVPFTEREFLAVVQKHAPDKLVRISGRAPALIVRRRKPFSNQPNDFEHSLVPVHQYLAQLNQQESFLNGLGLTLRDGPLRAGKSSPVIFSDMGDVLRLRSWQEVHPKEQCQPAECLPEFVAHVPDLFFHPQDPLVRRRLVRFDTSGVRLVRSARARARFVNVGGRRTLVANADLRLRTSGAVSAAGVERQLGDVQLLPIGVNPVTNRPRIMMFGGIVDGFGKLVDKGKELAKEAIIDGAVELGCDAARAAGIHIDGCPDGGSSSSSPTGSEESAGAAVDPNAAKGAGDPSCLYGTQGALAASLTPVWRTSATATVKSGWFEAGTMLLVNMQGSQQGNHLRLTHSGRADVSVGVLGINFTLAEYTRATGYDSTANPKFAPPAGNFAVPILGLTSLQDQFKQEVIGPGATFMVGPVPITVGSKVTLAVGPAGGAENFVQPPLDCTPGAPGRLDLFLGANVRADVELFAKVDAVVASAGVDAVLTLMDDTVGARLTTEIAPTENAVRVTPALSYDVRHLAGQVRLFVEVDLIAYTKKWSVVILDSNGIDPPAKAEPAKPTVYTFASKKK